MVDSKLGMILDVLRSFHTPFLFSQLTASLLRSASSLAVQSLSLCSIFFWLLVCFCDSVKLLLGVPLIGDTITRCLTR